MIELVEVVGIEPTCSRSSTEPAQPGITREARQLIMGNRISPPTQRHFTQAVEHATTGMFQPPDATNMH